MNETFAKRGFRMVLVALMVSCGLLMTNRVEAQTVSSNTSSKQLQWLTEQEALAALLTQMTAMKAVIANVPPGTSQYNNLANHIYYYRGIYEQILNGVTVADAVESAWNVAILGTSTQPTSPTLNKQLTREVTNLLTN
jgi:hypothetical protein